MRLCVKIAALALAASCGSSKQDSPHTPATTSVDDAALQLPMVGAAAARAVRAKTFVRIDRSGAIAVGDVPVAARKGAAIDLASLGAGEPIALAALHDRLYPPPPPAPPPTATPDVDVDGGAGTAMLLDEGKMGTQVGDDHPYKMQKNVDQEHLAREQALEQAKNAGVLGTLAANQGSVFASLTGTGGDDPADPGPAPLDAYALDGDGGPAAESAPIVVADARAPARALLDAVRAADGTATIAVETRAGDPARALAIAFGLSDVLRDNAMVEQERPDMELVLAIDAAGARLTAQRGDTPIDGGVAWSGAADPAAIAGAYAKARATADWNGSTEVRIVVDDHVTVGTFVVALAAVAEKGARTFHASGPAGGAPAGTVGTRSAAGEPQINIGTPVIVGDFDRAILHRYIKRNLNKISYCYEKPAFDDPKLHGTVTVDFAITPSGTVAAAKAIGVSPEVSSCIADVIQAIDFPKPKSGGTVNVTYPFTFSMTRDP